MVNFCILCFVCFLITLCLGGFYRVITLFASPFFLKKSNIIYIYSAIIPGDCALKTHGLPILKPVPKYSLIKLNYFNSKKLIALWNRT